MFSGVRVPRPAAGSRRREKRPNLRRHCRGWGRTKTSGRGGRASGPTRCGGGWSTLCGRVLPRPARRAGLYLRLLPGLEFPCPPPRPRPQTGSVTVRTPALPRRRGRIGDGRPGVEGLRPRSRTREVLASELRAGGLGAGRGGRLLWPRAGASGRGAGIGYSGFADESLGAGVQSRLLGPRAGGRRGGSAGRRLLEPCAGGPRGGSAGSRLLGPRTGGPRGGSTGIGYLDLARRGRVERRAFRAVKETRVTGRGSRRTRLGRSSTSRAPERAARNKKDL